jgi:hypothetical protein
MERNLKDKNDGNDTKIHVFSVVFVFLGNRDIHQPTRHHNHLFDRFAFGPADDPFHGQ